MSNSNFRHAICLLVSNGRSFSDLIIRVGLKTYCHLFSTQRANFLCTISKLLMSTVYYLDSKQSCVCVFLFEYVCVNLVCFPRVGGGGWCNRKNFSKKTTQRNCHKIKVKIFLIFIILLLLY
eukprot:TCONS_00067422-protein